MNINKSILNVHDDVMILNVHDDVIILNVHDDVIQKGCMADMIEQNVEGEGSLSSPKDMKSVTRVGHYGYGERQPSWSLWLRRMSAKLVTMATESVSQAGHYGYGECQSSWSLWLRRILGQKAYYPLQRIWSLLATPITTAAEERSDLLFNVNCMLSSV